MAKCSPPKSRSVRSHWRRKGTQRKGRSTVAKPGATYYAVVRNGRVISKHRHWTAAVNARKKLDLASYRRGQGRPYDVEKRTG